MAETGDEEREELPSLSRAQPVVVGIGASAGGVRALQHLFDALPEKTGAAFVVVVHLDPDTRSEMPRILAARTHMPVVQVEEPVRLQADHVYVIPPDRRLHITNEEIATAEFDEPRGRRAPIDLFFRSLAEQHGDSCAVILTGAGSDGAVGVRAVKESSGIILVQDPAEAEFPSMPRAAIATGIADFILPVRELAQRLTELVREKSNRGSGDGIRGLNEDLLRRILAHVRVRTGHDFSKYKRATILRRIARRMQVTRSDSPNAYYDEGRVVEQAVEGQPVESDSGNEIIVRLREELQATQARLRTTREESESANEELRAANEELQSINEEYRSTSEELETSKEELQSINEELQTVNSELKLKLEAVSRAHSDLQNLMAATDFGTLFLDAGLRIKRFTQQVTELFSITPSDEGRPISDFAHRLEYDNLVSDTRKVLSNLTPIRHEIRSRDDRWFDVRLRPYRTVDDKIDGVVLTFVDMTDRKTLENQQRLLLRELTHRVKNTLTVVQSITHRTKRFSKTYEDFTDRLDGRIAALAAAHTLLVDTEWRGADLATLAQNQLEPHLGGKTDRFQITGEPVFLPADLATPFALVFHELATNAAKYGAFSRRAGTVDLNWKLQGKNGEPVLAVTWRERGGPKTSAPKSKGFGSELIERAIPNASVRREFGRDGVICTIEVGLPKTE